MTQSRYDTSVAADRAAIQSGLVDAGVALEATLRRTQLRLVAGHAGALGGFASTNVSDGVATLATYRQRVVFPPGKFSNLQFVFPNWRLVIDEAAGDNDITVKAYFELGGAVYPLFFNGAASVVIAANASAMNDPIALDIDGQPQAWVRTVVSVSSGGKWPLGRYNAGGLGEGGVLGSDLGNATGISGLGSAVMYGPTAVVGLVAQSTPSVIAITDSRGAGVGEASTNGDGSGNVGYVERALSNKIAWTGIQRSGATVTGFNSTHWRAMARAPQYVTSALCQRGINDVRGAASLATMQSVLLSEWTNLSARYGLAVFQTTLDPVTTSTDGWTTVAGQAVVDAGQEAVRVAVNDWIRAGAPIDPSTKAAVSIGTSGALLAGQAGHPLTGYFEVADRLESTRNSGSWAVSPTARNLPSSAISSGTNILTCSTGNFTSADVGTSVYVPGAGSAGAALITQVSAVTNSTTVTLVANAATTVSTASAKIGGLTTDGLHACSAGHAAGQAGIDVTRFR